MTAAKVRSDAQFPSRCHRCYLPTSDQATIVGCDPSHIVHDQTIQKIEIGKVILVASLPFVVIASCFFGPIGFIFALALSLVGIYLSKLRRREDRFQVTTNIPTCLTCQNQELIALETSWERATMIILVHPNFAKQLKHVNHA